MSLTIEGGLTIIVKPNKPKPEIVPEETPPEEDP